MTTSAHELARTYDCKVPGCDGDAKTNTGLYAYLCERHTAERKKATPAQRPTPSKNGHTVAQLRGLTRMAREVDRLQEKATQATTVALAAKRAYEEAHARYELALREAIGGADRS